MKKPMFLLEYIRQDYIANEKGRPVVRFKQSESGKMLTKMLNSIGITGRDYDIDFDFDKIPEPQKVDNRTGKIYSYKKPKQSELKEPEARLLDRLLKKRPDIIIPTGGLGCKNLLGVASITKTRGVPVKVKLAEDYEPWVFPMFSMEYYIISPNVENLLKADLGTLGKYLTEGDNAFIPKKVNYELVMDIDRVREIFDYLYTNKPMTAWDLETNSLMAEAIGAKPLILSMSWKEAQGVTIPLEKKEAPWDESELEVIRTLLKRFVGDEDQPKVLHNGKFDLRFLMGTWNFTDFNYNMDTLIGYYLSITQEIESSKRLSDLAYELTDMGGYDDPLEEYKKEYTQKYVDAEKEKIDQQKAEKKVEIEANYKEAMKAYNEKKVEYKSEGKPVSSLEKPKKEKMPKFPTKTSIKLVNKVDGGNFNYDWIPLDVIHPYASGDVDCCLRIYNVLKKRIEPNKKMYKLWTEFYPRLTRTLASVEHNGMELDREYAKTIIEKYTDEQQRLLKEIRGLDPVKKLEEEHRLLYQAGVEEFEKPVKDRDKEIANLRNKYNPEKGKTDFNPTSPDHKGKLLYKIMKLTLPYDKECIKEKPFGDGVQESDLTWEDYKTDKHALEYIMENYSEGKEVAELLLTYSKVNTLKNNFAIKLPNVASKKDGRVHGSYLMHGTATGRLSSRDPK